MTIDELARRLRADASAASVDPMLIDASLRTLRAAFDVSEDAFERRVAICAEIGIASDPRWRKVLVVVREAYDESAVGQMVRAIDSAFVRSVQDGWNAWLSALARALVNFRVRYLLKLCEAEFPFTASHRPVAVDLRRVADRIAESRWDEVDDDVAFLVEQVNALPAPTRARLIAIQGQIEMWRFSEMRRARELMDQALRLAPDSGWILASIGDHQLESHQPDQAEGSYRAAIKLAPAEGNAYAGIGNCYETAGAYDKAEEWYRQAMANAPGDAVGYDRLARLLARVDFYQNQAQINDLLERRNAVDPEGNYDACLALGNRCKDANLQEEAQAWYERARSSEPKWPAAYFSMAELARQKGDTEKALTLGKAALALAPDYSRGYVDLGRIYEDRRRWTDVLRLYQRFPDRPRRWTLFARVTMARMSARLDDREAAQRQMLEVLREEVVAGREQVFAAAALEELARDCGREDRDAGLRLLRQILEVRGPDYTARFHNLSGNLYYSRREYAEAARHYREASEADPKSAPFRRYLASAYRAMGQFEEAKQEIAAAFALDADPKQRDDALAEVENVRGNRAYEQADYRQATEFYARALELAPTVVVYHTNAAGAWERLKEPGRRIEHLRKAQSLLEMAQRLDADPAREQRIESFGRRQDLVRQYGEQALDWSPQTVRIAVELASDLIALAEGSGSALSAEMASAVESMRDRVKRGLGIEVPGLRFRGNEGTMPRGTFIVIIDEIPLVLATIPTGRQYFVGSGERLKDKSIKGEPASDTNPGAPGFWVADADAGRVGAPDDELWTPAEFVVRRVESWVWRNAADFIGCQDVVALLEGTAGDLRDAMIASDAAIKALTLVCKALVAENVPIRPFEDLCASFRAHYDRGLLPAQIVERVRALPGFREHLPGRAGTRRFVRCGEALEDEIRDSLYGSVGREVLAMDPSRCQTALSAIRDAVNGAGSVLVVSDPVLRPHVRKLMALEFPDVPVLSAAEMRDDCEYAGRVMVDYAPPAEAAAGRRAEWPIAPRPDPAPPAEPASAGVLPIELALAGDFLARPSPADQQSLPELLSLMRDGLFYELGILVPRIELREDAGLEGLAFRIRIGSNEPVIAAALVGHDEFLVNESAQNLRLLRLDGRETVNPANGNLCAIVSGLGHLQTCRDAALTVWGPAGCLVLRLSAEIRRSAASFQDEMATRSLLDALAASHPKLVEQSLQRFPLPKLAQIFRHLLAEEISIRDLRRILDALFALDGTTDVDLGRFIVFGSNAAPLCPDPEGRSVSDLPPSLLADYVRTCSQRLVSNKFARASATLTAYLLAPQIERWLRDTARDRRSDDLEAARFIEAVRAELESQQNAAVLLTSFDVRGVARRVLRDAFPALPVLCYEELSPDLNILPLARIGWSKTAERQ